MAKHNWSINEAKGRLDEVAKAARRKPQIVTDRGKPVAVVMGAAEYELLRKLERLRTPRFAEALLAMPRCDIEFERHSGTLRDVEF